MRPILHDSYANLSCVDYKWDGGHPLPPPNSIVHVPMDHFAEFNYLCDLQLGKYIVISSNSDYGIYEQKYNTPEDDMRKWLLFLDCSGLGYGSLNIPPRYNMGHCKTVDKYSIKMHTWTNATISNISGNILHWFCTGAFINDNKITHMPFGISETVSKLITTQKFKTRFGIYINFQNNNIMRPAIKNMFRGLPDVLIEDDISHQDYVNRLYEYPLIISPPGNGGACYRTLESLYAGSVPVVINDEHSKAYDGLPVIKVDSYENIYGSLKEIWDNDWDNLNFNLENTKADLHYWNNIIQQSKLYLS